VVDSEALGAYCEIVDPVCSLCRRSGISEGLREEYTRSIEPARARAAETLKLEHTLSDLVNQASGLTPAEIDLVWTTAPSRMPIAPPAI
jgi:hypothetical protein